MPRNRLIRWLLSVAVVLAIGIGAVILYEEFLGSTSAYFDHEIDDTARDVTSILEQFDGPDGLDRARVEAAFDRTSDRLRGVRIVVVPSYLADGLLATNRIGLTDYFRTQLKRLRAAGLTIELAPVNTEASVAKNAAALTRLVAEDERPICFISHSKGGLDTLEFLLSASLETRERVACWVAFQSPFHGSPIADLAAGSKPLRTVADPLAKLLGGSGQSLIDLTVAVRRPYMMKHDDAVRAILGKVPFLAVVTRIDTPSLTLPTLYMRPAFDWMTAQGIPNDGLVPVASAIMPGARYIVIPGLDHADTVADNPIIDASQRTLLLKALLAIALGSD